jgi:hypothetical protein
MGGSQGKGVPKVVHKGVRKAVRGMSGRQFTGREVGSAQHVSVVVHVLCRT